MSFTAADNDDNSDYNDDHGDDAIAQVCYLNCDRLLLGNVPMMTCSRRIVTITNTSTTHCMQYTWHVTNECHAQVNHRQTT